MKQLRLVFAALAIVAAGAWAIAAIAGDKKPAADAKGSCAAHVATAAHSSMSAGQCDSMDPAECQARMAAGETCPMHAGQKAAATTASMDGCCAGGKTTATATTAAAGKCPYSGATAGSMEGCSAHGAKATTASMEGCSAHGAKATTASMDGCCAGKGSASATTASAAGSKSAGSCAAHGATAATASSCGSASAKSAASGHTCSDQSVSAMAAGLGSGCSGHDKTAHAAHLDCEACDDLTTCDAELQAAGAAMQTVPIKNGVMFVYTAKASGGVNAIQSVMSRRTEHLARIVSSGSKARLCDECKSMRGAMASGRLVREVVNIDGGTLVLVTSNDPVLVKRIREQADAGKMAVKS